MKSSISLIGYIGLFAVAVAALFSLHEWIAPGTVSAGSIKKVQPSQSLITSNSVSQQTVSFKDVKRDFPVATAPQSVRVADFNGDGISDLVTANSGSNDVTVLLGRGDGSFGRPINSPAGKAPSGVAV